MALSQSQIDAIERPGYVAPVFPTTKKAGVGSATKPKTSTASGGSSTPTVISVFSLRDSDISESLFLDYI